MCKQSDRHYNLMPKMSLQMWASWDFRSGLATSFFSCICGPRSKKVLTKDAGCHGVWYDTISFQNWLCNRHPANGWIIHLIKKSVLKSSHEWLINVGSKMKRQKGGLAFNEVYLAQIVAIILTASEAPTCCLATYTQWGRMRSTTFFHCFHVSEWWREDSLMELIVELEK